jgi:hypothetical protein
MRFEIRISGRATELNKQLMCFCTQPLQKAGETNRSKFHRSVTVFCSTWNMGMLAAHKIHRVSEPILTDVLIAGNMRMPDSLATYLPRKNYDIYVVGAQECDFVHVCEVGSVHRTITHRVW